MNLRSVEGGVGGALNVCRIELIDTIVTGTGHYNSNDNLKIDQSKPKKERLLYLPIFAD